MKTQILTLFLALPGAALAQDSAGLDAADFKGRPYSPYADRDYPTRLLFGDVHVHSGLSADAGGGGTRLMPRDAGAMLYLQGDLGDFLREGLDFAEDALVSNLEDLVREVWGSPGAAEVSLETLIVQLGQAAVRDHHRPPTLPTRRDVHTDIPTDIPTDPHPRARESFGGGGDKKNKRMSYEENKFVRAIECIVCKH